MSDWLLRPASTADARDIASVHVRAWQQAYRGLIPEPMLASLSVDRRETWWRSILGEAATRTHTWVASRDDRLGGFVTWGASRDADAVPGCGELMAIYLDPDVWGRRIGGALHERCVAGLVELGFTTATLWVLDGNERALGFYRHCGWSDDAASREEDWDGATLRESRLRRALP